MEIHLPHCNVGLHSSGNRRNFRNMYHSIESFFPFFFYTKWCPTLAFHFVPMKLGTPWTNFAGPSKFKYIETITQMSSDGAT